MRVPPTSGPVPFVFRGHETAMLVAVRGRINATLPGAASQEDGPQLARPG